MNVMIVIPSLEGGGAERAFVNLSSHFRAKGWNVTIATFGSSHLDAYQLDQGVQRIELGLFITSRNPVIGALLSLCRVFRIRNAIKSLRPDIVVGVMPAAGILSILATVSTKIPVIVAERSHPGAILLPMHWRVLRKLLYRYANAVTVQTEAAAVWIRSVCKMERVEVIPNACHWPVADSPPFVPIPDGNKICLAAGRFGPEKGFDLLLEAWGRISYRFPDWRLAIAGTGEQYRSIQQRVFELGLENQVSLPGRVGNMAMWYARAEMFVLSSRFEGFPNVLVEALASGCAAVAYDCLAGPADIVRNGIDGILVRPGEVEELANAMEKLMANPDLLARYRAAAPDIISRLSVDQVYDRWEVLFRTYTLAG
ncbi:glycosyltransferase family 4 protein [Sphingosinicella sp.]|uniref:glycosyltransferase family 4 protein n=1 Tax=Sphingosinicella sp. TaxID=1917971 RepID=UPI0017C084E5|nr:glycosyltransferase family 4 protein [Sphingosinicella sp.]MBA4759681.1 glycosyltransferase family 4 protein [Sphingosinicella sp.]